MERRLTAQEDSYLGNSKQYQRGSLCTLATEKVNSNLKRVVIDPLLQRQPWGDKVTTVSSSSACSQPDFSFFWFTQGCANEERKDMRYLCIANSLFVSWEGRSWDSTGKCLPKSYNAYFSKLWERKWVDIF